MEVPFLRSYWVQTGQLLAGCYPGAPDKHEATQKLNSLLDSGIRAIVNLMEPEETDHHGNPFKQYEDLFKKLATQRHVDVVFIRQAIPDMCIPTRETMREILDTIDELIENGMPVFVHCWGGKGRTGTVVGCWLARHGLVNGQEALGRIQYLRRNDPMADDPSPQNAMQCNMVQSWRVGE